MMQKLLEQKKYITGVGVLLVVLVGVYYFFFSTPSQDIAKASIQTSLLSGDVTTFLARANKINLNDDSFRKNKNKVLYEDLHDYSQDIPLIPPPGRANPFVPYVAP